MVLRWWEKGLLQICMHHWTVHGKVDFSKISMRCQLWGSIQQPLILNSEMHFKNFQILGVHSTEWAHSQDLTLFPFYCVHHHRSFWRKTNDNNDNYILHLKHCVAFTLNSTYKEVAFNEKSPIMKENIHTKYTSFTYKYITLNKKPPITKENLRIFFPYRRSWVYLLWSINFANITGTDTFGRIFIGTIHFTAKLRKSVTFCSIIFMVFILVYFQ